MDLERLAYVAYDGDSKLRLQVILEFVETHKDEFLKWFEVRYTKYCKTQEEKDAEWKRLLDRYKKDEEEFEEYLAKHGLKRKK